MGRETQSTLVVEISQQLEIISWINALLWIGLASILTL
jgi:hypothetical protein